MNGVMACRGGWAAARRSASRLSLSVNGGSRRGFSSALLPRNSVIVRTAIATGGSSRDVRSEGRKHNNTPWIHTPGATRFASTSTATGLPSDVPVQDLLHQGGEVLNAIEALSRREEIIQQLALQPLSNVPSDLAIQFMNSLAIVTDAPWWVVMVATALCVRITMFPLIVAQMRTMAKMQNIGPEIQQLTQRSLALNQQGKSEEARAVQIELIKTYNKHGVNPMMIYGSMIVQLPVMGSFFFAINKIVTLYPSMHTGGILWFSDLATPDASLGLPLISAALMVSCVQISSVDPKLGTTMSNKMKYAFMGFLSLSPLFTMHFPAGLQLYFIGNSLFQLTQVSTFRFIPSSKSLLGIPALQRKPQDPFEAFARQKEAVQEMIVEGREEGKAAAEGIMNGTTTFTESLKISEQEKADPSKVMSTIQGGKYYEPTVVFVPRPRSSAPPPPKLSAPTVTEEEKKAVNE